MVDPARQKAEWLRNLQQRVASNEQELRGESIPRQLNQVDEGVRVSDSLIVTETTVSTTTELVDDFEDGDITTKASNWDGWGVDTGSLSAQQSTVLSGSWSGELTVSSGSDVLVRSNRDNPVAIDEVSCRLEISSLDGGVSQDAQAFRTEGPDLTSRDLASGCDFSQNGDIAAGANNDSVGTWSAGTTYDVRLYNHDFTNDTYDVEVTRVSDGTVIGSATGADFYNSVSEIQSVRARNDADSGNSGSPTLYFDDVEVVY